MNPISEVTNDVTGKMLQAALGMTSMTHQVIAHNIANVNSPGFVPLRVRFDDVLEQLSSQSRATAKIDNTAIQLAGHVEPDPEAAPGAGGVASLDVQMAKMNANFVRYQMLLHGLTHRIGLADTAMNDGRR